MPLAKGPCKCDLVKTRNGNYYRCELHQNSVDRKLRKRFPSGMRDGTDVTIEFNIGFENFGSYEDWGQGYVVSHIDPETGDELFSSAKYLEDAIDQFLTKPFRVKKEYVK